MPNLKYKESLDIASKTTYTNKDYQYLKNLSITEWDIHSAGLSVLKFRKLLPEEELEKLSNMEKHARTVYEGNLQRENPKLAEAIVKTLAQVRQAFVMMNDIPPDRILSIKKDAIFLINWVPKYTVIKDVFEFRKKNTYTSFAQIEKKEFYYNSANNSLDIKGINKEGVKLQEDFLIKEFCKIFRSAERIDMTSLYELLRIFRKSYLNRSFPIQYYRELDSGLYRVGKYTVKNLSENEKETLDISQNYMQYVLPLIQVLL